MCKMTRRISHWLQTGVKSSLDKWQYIRWTWQMWSHMTVTSSVRMDLLKWSHTFPDSFTPCSLFPTVWICVFFHDSKQCEEERHEHCYIRLTLMVNVWAEWLLWQVYCWPHFLADLHGQVPNKIEQVSYLIEMEYLLHNLQNDYVVWRVSMEFLQGTEESGQRMLFHWGCWGMKIRA
jgi:hypothetical protein